VAIVINNLPVLWKTDYLYLHPREAPEENKNNKIEIEIK